jgi:hypothetical protein
MIGAKLNLVFLDRDLMGLSLFRLLAAQTTAYEACFSPDTGMFPDYESLNVGG